jgi:cytochrome c-type biogenesis protein
MNETQLSLGAAFLAGLASFLSPCMLPLVPIYLVQLVGRNTAHAVDEPHDSRLRFTRLHLFAHACLFVLGFSLVFIALGATASALGSVLRLYQVALRQIGGVLLVVIGLQVTGLLRLPLLLQMKRFSFQPSHPGYVTSLLIGSIFALGWTPCISLLLGSILVIAATTTTLHEGVVLLTAYSLGMGLPFLLLGLGATQASAVLRWLKPQVRAIEVGSGVVVILVGLAIFFNVLALLNSYFLPFFHG